MFEYHLDKGIRSLTGDSAHVVHVPGHLDVALLAPALAPGVLDEEVVLAVLSAVADGEDTVVELLGVAVLVRVDS